MNKQVSPRYRIGEVYYIQFGGQGNEQRGWRPGIVFQNNMGNKYSPNIIALPLTSKLKKRSQPTHVFLPADQTGVPRDSIVLCENPSCVSKDRIGGYITTLPTNYMRDVALAHLLATSAISFIDSETLALIWQQSLVLNSAA